MEHAWLDSLSEDWVSQPGSDTSPSAPATSLPKPNNRHTGPSRPKSSGSRIPRLSVEGGVILGQGLDSNILSERSASEINIKASHRAPSKLSQEIKLPERGRQLSRSVSASTSGGSVVHNTVNHKSKSLSPDKQDGETPEWKRRLINGNLAYGEQRDLFTCAGVGLENIFKPPAAGPETFVDYGDGDSRNETTIPSSPPLHYQGSSSFDIHVDNSVARTEHLESKRPKTRAMQYRMTEEDGALHSTDTTREEESDDADSSIPTREYSRMRAPPTNQHPSVDQESRKASGQSILRHEEFSPIMISPEKPGVDEAGFAPLELPPSELQRRLEMLRWNQLMMADDITAKLDSHRTTMDGNSLNIENTKDFEKAGGFINFRRGGRSADGSFRYRALSPPVNAESSEMLPEESLQASTPKQYPTVRAGQAPYDRQTPPLPRVPHPSPEKRGTSGRYANGSPLKLFGPYDTFTNQTLMRRISQFEDDVSENPRTSAGQSTQSGEDGLSPSELKSQMPSNPQAPIRQSSSQFGLGELDGYEFNEEFSGHSRETWASDKEASEPEPNHSAGEAVPLFKFSVSRTSSATDRDELVVHRHRQKSSLGTTSSKTSTRPTTITVSDVGPDGTLHVSRKAERPSTPRRKDAGSEAKRPRTSPSKDPTPKRRRTLHRSDIAYRMDDSQLAAEALQSSHAQMQSVIGRKRRDARDGDIQELANPGVLATRQILRPRTPTPSQRSSVQREQHPHASINQTSHDKLTGITTDAPSMPRGSPSRPGASVSDLDRKPSIKTEDFMNEANKIMEMLRNRGGRPSGGLASVEESESELGLVPPAETEGSFQESTREPFSRPPSREGRPVSRLPARQDDPEVAARLKIYEEGSDVDDLVSSTTRSLNLARDMKRAAKEVEAQVEAQIRRSVGRAGVPVDLESDSIVSDPPNIRISENPIARNGPSVVESGAATAPGDGFSSQGSASSGNSTGRSIPTGSSRGSDSRKTIAPQTVSHLIPEQVGNMVWDKQQNVWVKRKNSVPRHMTHNILPSEGSEDDPFAGIPDLTIDATMELQNIRVGNHPGQGSRPHERPGSSTSSPAKSPKANPAMKPVLIPRNIQTVAAIASSHPPSRLAREVTVDDTDEIEHEITIYEARDTHGTPSRRRNLTISFSSPIASIIQDFVGEESGHSAGVQSVANESTAELPVASIQPDRRKVPILKNAKSRGRGRSRSNSRGLVRQISVAGEAFIPRPISRIEERDEETMLAKTSSHKRGLSRRHEPDLSGQRQTSLSFVVTTPGRQGGLPSVDQAQIISQLVGTLSLTPMSDFTAHQDLSQSMGLEASYVAGDRHLVTGDGSRAVMSQTLRDLVDRIAEVEPFEPHWEDMEELDLQDKRISSLHKLDEFCGNLVNLIVSKNGLRNLSGAARSLRHLAADHNQLTELTSWAHLSNLQYIDISNNDIKTLSGLKNLVHLRMLKADNCNLRSLDALQYHEGIQELQARGNLIQALDFEGTRLRNLVNLDLEGNQIASVANIDQLRGLRVLNLKRNALEDFTITAKAGLASLTMLELSDNRLAQLDISLLPSIQTLYVDRNRLVCLTGLSKTHKLDSLSLREQETAARLDMSSIYQAHEIRKLYLSGNAMGTFNPPIVFLNLQLLELANCGLTSLPKEFGSMMPNIRKLNLNFNALSCLRCLQGIPRIKKLDVAGNRLASTRSVVRQLREFKYLGQVDLRDNPITQGFYASLQGVMPTDEREPFGLPDVDVAKDKAYCSRLDLDTGMNRRVHEHFIGLACKRLQKLDGLPVNRGLDKVRDAVHKALVAKGVFDDDGSNEDAAPSSRWGVEDSFA